MLRLVCVVRACGAIYLPVVRIGAEDAAEAVHLEAKLWRNKDGVTINYG